MAMRAFLAISIHLSCLYSLYMVPPFGPSASAMYFCLGRFGSMSCIAIDVVTLAASVQNQYGSSLFSLFSSCPADECYSPSLMANFSGAFSRRFLSSGDEM